MSRTLLVGATLVVFAAGVLTADSAVAATGSNGGVWTIRKTAALAGDDVLGLGASSPTDVWGVGRVNGQLTTDPWSEHWDGSTWSAYPVPIEPGAATASLGNVAVLGPDDAWASGRADDSSNNAWGILRHWDGQAWSSVKTPAAGAWSIYTGLAFASPTDGWLAGAHMVTSSSATTGLLDRWDGNAWTSYAIPKTLCGGASFLYDLKVVATDDAWTIGSCGSGIGTPLALHWDGTTWTKVDVPIPTGVTEGFVSGLTMVSPTEAWAFGEQFAPTIRPLIEHWNGTSWAPVANPATTGDSYLLAGAAVSTGDVWAVGRDESTLLSEHWDGSSWTIVSGVDPYNDSEYLGSIIALPGPELWTAGYRLFEELDEAPVADTGLAQTTVNGIVGAPVTWHFSSTNTLQHSVSDATGLSLFDSGLRKRNRSFVYRYSAAGRFVVSDATSGDTQNVSIPPQATAKTGQITVKWAAASAPTGFVYDVRIKRPGSSTFSRWQTSVTAGSASFSPAPGTYAFRARLRESSSGSHSGWSPTVSARV